MGFVISLIKKIFGGNRALDEGTIDDNARGQEAKRVDTRDETLTNDNADQSKQESMDVWDEIDNIRQSFWLGGWYSRRHRTRPKEQLDEEIKELKEKLGEKGEGEGEV